MSADSKGYVIPIHYTPSMKVEDWLQIEEQAQAVADFIDKREYGPFKSEMFALHHSQVSEKPFNFFVLNPMWLPSEIEQLGSRFIVNPEIITELAESKMAVSEGCVSFPHRKERLVERYMLAIVGYDVPDPTSASGLKRHEKEVSRILAQIFQHECDHGKGKNIHYSSK